MYVYPVRLPRKLLIAIRHCCTNCASPHQRWRCQVSHAGCPNKALDIPSPKLFLSQGAAVDLPLCPACPKTPQVPHFFDCGEWFPLISDDEGRRTTEGEETEISRKVHAAGKPEKVSRSAYSRFWRGLQSTSALVCYTWHPSCVKLQYANLTLRGESLTPDILNHYTMTDSSWQTRKPKGSPPKGLRPTRALFQPMSLS